MKKEFPDPRKLLLQKEFPGKERIRGDKAEFTLEDQDFLSASSYTDCTGLIPSAPKTEHELESYEQIQHFLPPTCPADSQLTEEEHEEKIWN